MKRKQLLQNVINKILLTSVLFGFISSVATAAPNRINFQAKIKKPDGSNLEAPDVSFRFKYINSAGNCTLYMEDFNNISMFSSAGNVSFSLGSGAKVFPPTATDLAETFSNTSTNTMSCYEGGNYTPVSTTEHRKLRVEFVYAGSGGLQALNGIEINSTPYAMYASDADKLAGFAASLYAKFSDFTTCTGGQVLTYDGSVFSCVSPGASSSFTGNLVGDVTGTQSATVVDTVGGKTSAQVSTSVDDTTNATNAATASRIVKRDASGNAAFNTAQANNFSGRNVLLFEPTDTNHVTIVAPTTFAAGDYTLTLPDSNGSPGYVLSTDGNGVTSWIPAASGSVTSVTATPPLLSSGGATPDISMPAATAAVDGYLSAADFTTFNSKVSSQWSNNGADIFFNTGNVGIGTNTPTVKAHIYDAIDGVFNGLVIDNRKTYGPGAGTNETSRMILSLSEAATPDPLTRVMGYVEAGTEDELSSGNGFMAFGTRNTGAEVERVRINSSGDVGIGTTTPAHKLDVVGDVNITGNYKVNGVNIGSGTLGGTGTVNKVAKFSAASTVTDSIITDDGTNVGIGTASPTNPLTVVGTGGMGGGGPAPLAVVSTDDAPYTWSTTGMAPNLTAGNSILNLVGKSSTLNNSGYMAFNYVGAGSTSNFMSIGLHSTDNLLNVTGGGDVGIGTTAPEARLDVRKGLKASNNVLAIFKTTDAQPEQFFIENQLNTGVILQAGEQFVGNNNLLLNSYGGNVGVGMTSPAYKLDVAGDVNVTGAFKVNGVDVPLVATQWTTNGANIHNNNAGNVGIGTNTPTSHLHVVSDSGTNAALATIGTPIFSLQNTSATDGSINAMMFNNRAGFSTAAIYNLQNGINGGTQMGLATKAAGSGLWNTDQLILDPSGNVGIGNTNPATKLQVGSTGTDEIRVGRMSFNTNAVNYIDESFGVRAKLADSAGAHRFIVENGSGSAVLSAKSDGNVGIGTNTPTARLTIQGTSAAGVSTTSDNISNYNGSGIRIDGSIANSSREAITYTSGGGGGAGLVFERDGSFGTGISLYTNPNGNGVVGDMTKRFTIMSNGNVGVGVAAPAYNLDVAGDVNVTGNFKVNGVNVPLVATQWTTNGTHIYNNNAGNVGIGTNTPGEKFQVLDGNISMKTSGATTTPVIKWQGSDNSERFIISGATETLGGSTDEWKFANGFGFTSFINSNVETMRLTSDNKVGIGTTTPNEKLSVVGDMSITGDLKMNGPDSYIWTNGSGTGYTGIWDQANGRNLLFATETTGFVGIGTTAPAAKLDVQGSILIPHDQALRSGSSNWIIGQNSNPLNTIAIGSTVVANDIRFDSSTAAGLMMVKNTGNVGIGTINPASKLEVAGDINVGINDPSIATNTATYGNRLFFLGANYNSDPFWMARYNDTPDNSELRVNIGDNPGVTPYVDKFVLGVEAPGWNPLMTVQSDGKVGINVSSPAHALDVAGDINVTGSFKVGGTNITSSQWSTSAPHIYYNTGNVGIGTNTPSTVGSFNYTVGSQVLNVTGGLQSVVNISGNDALLSLYESDGVADSRWNIIRNEGGALQFVPHNDSGSSKGTALSILNSNGNVGIGVMNPTAKLNISGGQIRSEATAADTDITRIPAASEIVLETAGDGAASSWLWREKWLTGNYGIFHDNSADTLLTVGNGAPIMSVGLVSTNVGIGIRNPTEKLEVNGAAKASNFYVNKGAYAHIQNAGDEWLRIATGAGSSYADFIISSDGSGQHGFTHFTVSCNFPGSAADDCAVNITHRTEHSGLMTVKAIRIVYLSTYDPYHVEILVGNTPSVGGTNIYTETKTNVGFTVPATPTVGSIPGGYSAKAINTENSYASFGNGQLNVKTTGVEIGAENGLVSGYGTPLSFLGQSSNTDYMWLARYNNGLNLSELRMNLGDDPGAGAEDRFVIGTTTVGWNPSMTVMSNGKMAVGVGHSDPISPIHTMEGDVLANGYRRSITMEAEHPVIQFKGHSDTNHSGFIGYDAQAISESMNFWVGGTTNDIGSANYAMRLFANGNVGIGSIIPAYKLDVDGNININAANSLLFGGTPICNSGGCVSPSDLRLKENVKPLDNSLSKILRLQGVEYDYKDKARFGSKHQVGVIAQDVEKVFPEVVVTNEKTGLKAVAYDHLVAPVIEAIKSLYGRILDHDREIASVKAENKQLKQENSEIKAYLCSKDPSAPICK